MILDYLARSISRLVHLNAGEEYHVVPACFEANLFGKFELNVLCDVVFALNPVERKLPIPSPAENKTSSPTTTATTRTKQVPKRGNISLAAARLSTLTNEYSEMNISE